MPGKPYQSKLRPFEEEIVALRGKGVSFREIAETLNRQHQLGVTHNAVYSFIKVRHPGRPLFYEGLSPDIRDGLVKQIAAVWTHDSTSIEGNTLTLGETVKVLELGLTISGKPLRDHQEVYGHARAIELIYRMIRNPEISREDLFDLHRAVMDKSAMDIMAPVGDWKQDFNGTTGVINGRSVYMEYAVPGDVPSLMTRWLKEFNRTLDKVRTNMDAVRLYSQAHLGFVRIHPFFDGNGRVARLVANLPVLRGGYPPIVIPPGRRSDYIEILWSYQNAIGRIAPGDTLVPSHPSIAQFETLLAGEWKETAELVRTARQLQSAREQADPAAAP